MTAVVHQFRHDPDYGMTAAEHLEEVSRLLGWDQGPWTITVEVSDGTVRRAVAHQHAPKVAATRSDLHALRRELDRDALEAETPPDPAA